jgi:hypothetical protein
VTSTWRKFSPSRVPPQLRRPWHASKRKQKHGRKHSQSAPVCQPCRLEPSPPQSAAVGLCIATVTGAPVHHSTPNTTPTAQTAHSGLYYGTQPPVPLVSDWVNTPTLQCIQPPFGFNSPRNSQLCAIARSFAASVDAAQARRCRRCHNARAQYRGAMKLKR